MRILIFALLVVMAVSTFAMPYPFSLVGFAFLAGAAYVLTSPASVNKTLTF